MNDDLQKQAQEAIDQLVESGAERGLQVAVYWHGCPRHIAAYVGRPATPRGIATRRPP